MIGEWRVNKYSIKARNQRTNRLSTVTYFYALDGTSDKDLNTIALDHLPEHLRLTYVEYQQVGTIFVKRVEVE